MRFETKWYVHPPCIYISCQYYYTIMLTISYSLIWKQAAGSRNDLRLKRKFNIAPPADEHVSSSNCEMVARVDVLYSANLAPPSWVHVYRAVTCTSVRTQAASIAYMFPHHINMMTQWTALRILNARTRCLKYETCLQNITVPPTSYPTPRCVSTTVTVE